MQVSTKGTFGHFGCGFTVLPRLMSTDCTYVFQRNVQDFIHMHIYMTVVCITSSVDIHHII